MRAMVIIGIALSALAVAAARADDDPEPPGKGGPQLRKLKGKWAVTKRLLGGREMKSAAVTTYEFSGEKVTVNTGRLTYVATVKADVKNKPFVLTLTREGTKTTTRMAFKLDKGELYLGMIPAKGNAKVDDDFTGTNRPVMVLEREKKKE